METRSFLLGLVTIPMYEYRCVMSKAQIELLSIDKPLVDYGTRRKEKGKKGHVFKRPNMIDVLDKAEEWKRKYKDGAKPKLDLSILKKRQ